VGAESSFLYEVARVAPVWPRAAHKRQKKATPRLRGGFCDGKVDVMLLTGLHFRHLYHPATKCLHNDPAAYWCADC
jgi:hypothetical protein